MYPGLACPVGGVDSQISIGFFLPPLSLLWSVPFHRDRRGRAERFLGQASARTRGRRALTDKRANQAADLALPAQEAETALGNRTPTSHTARERPTMPDDGRVR